MSIALGLVICILLFLAYHGRTSEAPATTATVLGGRSWKDVDLTKSQKLEVQLAKKDEEIDVLKQKLTRIVTSSRMAESNMASQESLIKSLQQRQEAEKAAKYKAMYALAERSKTLDECGKQQQALEEDLSTCQRDLQVLHKARTQ